MADQREKTEHQQNFEKVDQPEQKRQKREENNATEVKSITNICYDCLERIFDFLDLQSLLMVAGTCKRLQIAAAANFGDKFGSKRIMLNPNRQLISYRDSDTIEVCSLELCLPFIRCFGAKILDLYLRTECDVLNQYIHQYCADTLESISLGAKSQFLNAACKKPFKSVQKADIKYIRMKNYMFQNFAECFVNVRHLEIAGCWYVETLSMNSSFLQLEHLQIDIGKFRLGVGNAAYLLQHSPQLQSLTIQYGGDPSKLTLRMILDLIGSNPLITKLITNPYPYGPTIGVSTDELNRFVAEHPLIVDLALLSHRITPEYAIYFIGRLKSLKQIKFQVKDHFEYNRYWTD